MKIAVITGEQPQHIYLCRRLSESHDVVAIVHPKKRRKDIPSRIRRIRGFTKDYGSLHTLLHFSGRLSDFFSTRMPSRKQIMTELGEECLGKGVGLDIAPSAIFHDIAINSGQGIELINHFKPDAVVCLGGVIYEQKFIESCGLILNFHSGLSPIYNGFGTISFAFAQGHPFLCGGTMMLMSPVIDGGNILAHYLPEIRIDDNPGTLFLKTVKASAITYCRFLKHLETSLHYSSVPQSKPLFYFKSWDWTLQQSLDLKRNLAKGIAQRHCRPENLVEYWAEPTDSHAKSKFVSTLTGLLCGG